MNTIQWVMYASIVCWAGIGFYIFYLARKQRTMNERINQLTSLMENEE